MTTRSMEPNGLRPVLTRRIDFPGGAKDGPAALTSASNFSDAYPADPDFTLRTGLMNPMCDAAMPLLGLAMRLKTLDHHDDVTELYRRVHIAVTTILEEMRQLRYESVLISAYSYALCLHLDETVMLTTWGRQSEWSQQSLLSVFHDDALGGEKLYDLIARLNKEPKRFLHVLEFIYVVLCMGLRGKYAMDPNDGKEREKHITSLRRTIRELRGPLPELLPDTISNVAPCNARKRKYWPWWSPLLAGAGTIVAMYSYYSYQLHLMTENVLTSLNSILQP
ncbi:type IVB secretion system protein IcmH/DotU [Pseudomonas sp. NPDC089752]|uniref:type IVB secretion system protein IcmH/DotU n=1 Tax=Pseudomonas sp. NPDC089752 TaxID=3364472 RepID=UPI00382073A4